MYRFVAIGLTALILAACEPAAPPVAPAETPEPTATTEAPAMPTVVGDSMAMEDRYRQMETVPTDPVEALEYRAVICRHLSGEFGTGDPEREQALGAQAEELRCGDELTADIAAMREAQTSDPAMATRLEALAAYHAG